MKYLESMKKTIFILIGILLLISDLYSQNIVVLAKGDTFRVTLTQVNRDGIKYSYKLQDQVFEGQKTAKEIHSIALEDGIFLLFEDYLEKIYKNRTEEYCEILTEGDWFLGNMKLQIRIDSGQGTTKLDKHDVVGVLNWMNSKGWVYIDHYITYMMNTKIHHFLMKRDLKMVNKEEKL